MDMKEKLSTINRLLRVWLPAVLSLLACSAVAQEDTDSLEEINHPRYERHLERVRKGWNGLLPTHIKLQYAGNMGVLSLGTGWDYGKHKQWETDVYLGFLPKFKSSRPKITFTLKQNYIPWRVNIRNSRFSVDPLTCGLYFNTIFGHEFWVNEPSRYPKGYYGFSSKVRTNIYVGERLTYHIPPKYRTIAKECTFFYEISSCDLYIVSAFTNKYLKPKDYLSLSLGIKFQLM
jgi:hypothetical protein